MLKKKEGLHNELVRIAKMSARKRKLFTIALILILALLTVAAAWLFGRKQAKYHAEAEIADLKTILQEQEEQIKELIDTPIVVNPVAPEINLEIIYSEINIIGELATMEYLFTDAAKSIVILSRSRTGTFRLQRSPLFSSGAV